MESQGKGEKAYNLQICREFEIYLRWAALFLVSIYANSQIYEKIEESGFKSRYATEIHYNIVMA